ncbi:MAG TPA: ABC transporter substrate-binding protein [Firmicutes bacterium]|nr:ABC transporter substrate-binding protein [Bacillota bacterium]
MKWKFKHSLGILLTLTLLVGLFAGCSQGDTPSNSGTSANDRDSIVIATLGETPSVHPYDHNATAGSYMNLLTYDTLFHNDVNQNPQPHLVESYENIDDSTWQFTLKQGVLFHNGEEMKAQDVEASIEWAMTFAEVMPSHEKMLGIDVVDDYTFTLHTDGPYALLITNLASHGNAILPKSLIDQGHDFGEEPIGSGPYKLVEWNRGDSLVFEANEDYFNGAPAIKSMTWRIIPEGSGRTIALEAGEVDVVIEVESMDYERLKETEGITVAEYDSTSITWLYLNNEVPGLDNQNVRHAINSAINKESVVEVALNGLGTPAIGQLPSNLAGYSEENADAYDVERAREFLAASGVDPSTLSFPIITSNDTRRRAGEVIQANLQEIGINVELESMDLATYLSATSEGDYTAAIGGWTSNVLLDCLIGVYHSSGINASNKTRISDPELDALIDEAGVTLDEEERNAILEQACARANELCPAAPLFLETGLRAYNSDLKGVEVSQSGTIYFDRVSW